MSFSKICEENGESQLAVLAAPLTSVKRRQMCNPYPLVSSLYSIMPRNIGQTSFRVHCELSVSMLLYLVPRRPKSKSLNYHNYAVSGV